MGSIWDSVKDGVSDYVKKNKFLSNLASNVNKVSSDILKPHDNHKHWSTVTLYIWNYCLLEYIYHVYLFIKKIKIF